MPKDAVHPLIRDRAILVDLFGQLTKIAAEYKKAGWDHRPYEAEAKRVHMRLIAVQVKIEENELD